MPVIAKFYGILIKMYFKEHGIPHFHALYGEYNGVFELETLEMIEGDLPQRAVRMIKEWGTIYGKDSNSRPPRKGTIHHGLGSEFS